MHVKGSYLQLTWIKWVFGVNCLLSFDRIQRRNVGIDHSTSILTHQELLRNMVFETRKKPF